MDSTKVRRRGARATRSAGQMTDHAGRWPDPASRLRHAVGISYLYLFEYLLPDGVCFFQVSINRIKSKQCDSIAPRQGFPEPNAPGALPPVGSKGWQVPSACRLMDLSLRFHADPPLRGIIRLHTGVPPGSKVVKCDSLECGTMPNRSGLSMASVPIYRTVAR